MSSSGLNIDYRIANAADAGHIAALVNAAYRPQTETPGWTHESDLVEGHRTSPQDIIASIQAGSCLLLGCCDGDVLCCALITPHGADASIGMLAVSPNRQNQGIGATILAHAEELAAKTLKPDRFLLHVLESRTELIDFYARRGYTRSGNSLPYPIHANVGKPRMPLRVLELFKRIESHRPLI